MTPGARPDLLRARHFRAVLLFIPIAIPAGVLAVTGLAFGCVAQMLASSAGWLIDVYDSATRRSNSQPAAAPSEQFDLSPRAGLRDVRQGVCRVCRQAKMINADDRCIECYTTKRRPELRTDC